MQKKFWKQKKKERKKEKVGSFRFFLRHFIIFQTRIDDFEMCGGSPGQNFFRILAKKHFEKFFWVIFGDFFEEKIEDFSYKKDEILLQKNFLLHIKNIFFEKENIF